jgi:hypothetical protein
MNDIRAGLENHLLNTADIPLVELPNQKRERDPNVPFIRAQFTPTARRPDVRGPNPMQRVDGLYIMNVCQPEYVGEGPGLQIADLLLARFDASTDVSYLDFKIGINYSELGLNFPDPPFFCTPVVVNWFTYHLGEQS